MTELTRRGLLKAAGTLSAGSALAGAPLLTGSAGAQPVRASTVASNSARGAKPIDLGARLELIAGTQIIDQMMTGAEVRMHQPVRRGVVMTTDQPWEGSASHFRTVFKDEDIYRMYYLGLDYDVEDGTIRVPHSPVTAYAESDDGIHWTRPDLGLVEFEGSKHNNILFRQDSFNDQGVTIWGDQPFAAFKDSAPGVPSNARYKGIIHAGPSQGGGNWLIALQSADGIHWRLMSNEPILRWGDQGIQSGFDSLNVAFWDSVRNEYRLYMRESRDGVRGIKTATSEDFLHWTDPEWLKYPGSPETALYTNNVMPYYRAPHTYVAIPMRYDEHERSWQESHNYLPGLEARRERFAANPRYGTALTDTLFMSSRDGTTFDRWDDAYIRPGPGGNNWAYADNSPAWGLVETQSDIEGAPNELSMYATEGYWTGDDLDIVRYTTRIDGFVSVHAPSNGGELVTKPIRFTGGELVVNFATSASGSIRAEIQNGAGQPIDGFALQDSDPLFGDQVARTVSWRGGGSDLSSLERRPIRLRFVLEDADLYSLRFE